MKTLKLLFALGFFSAIASNFSSWTSPGPRVAPVKAEPYQWPEGCVQKRYDDYDEISEKCMDDRYLLTDEYAESLGADTRSRRGKWDTVTVAITPKLAVLAHPLSCIARLESGMKCKRDRRQREVLAGFALSFSLGLFYLFITDAVWTMGRRAGLRGHGLSDGISN